MHGSGKWTHEGRETYLSWYCHKFSQHRCCARSRSQDSRAAKSKGHHAMTQTMTPPPPQQTQAAQPVYEITAQDKKRQERIAEPWKAYNDDLEKPLQRMPAEPDDNVMTNRSHPPADSSLESLLGK